MEYSACTELRLYCHALNVTFSDFIGLPKNETADSAQPRNRSTVTDPFPLLRAGSGDETTKNGLGPRLNARTRAARRSIDFDILLGMHDARTRAARRSIDFPCMMRSGEFLRNGFRWRSRSRAE